MEITLGFSPCPNDTFIFHSLVTGRVQLPGHSIRASLHDVETLNQMAFDQILDATKLSFYAWLNVKQDYRLLTSGGALGYGCGPLVIARKPLKRSDMTACRIALPGRWTTAHLLFRLWAPKANQRFFTPYNQIFQTIDSGQADCGVIIHESRFTFEQAGFKAVKDLGAWWQEQTGLPIPLGCIATHRRLNDHIADLLETRIKQSIELVRHDPMPALSYIQTHAQEITPQVLQAHIDTFVNDFSLDLGDKGRAAVQALEQKAYQAGIIH